MLTPQRKLMMQTRILGTFLLTGSTSTEIYWHLCRLGGLSDEDLQVEYHSRALGNVYLLPLAVIKMGHKVVGW